MVNEATRQQFDTSITPRLRALGRRLRLYTLLDGLAVLCPAMVVAMLITLLVDRGFRLDRDIRVGQLVSGAVLLGFIAWRWIWSPLRVPAGMMELALLVERRFPQLQSRLVSAVEFTRDGAGPAPPARSRELMEAAVREAGRGAAGLPFQDALSHRRARKQAAVAFGCVAILALITFGARPTMALWFKRNILLSDAEWPQRNRLAVSGLKDGKLVDARGDDVSVSADVVPGFEAPRQVFIDYRTVLKDGSTGSTQRKQMPAVVAQAGGGGPKTVTSFMQTFERIEESLECRIFGGDARTDWFNIEVVDRPRIDEVTIGVVPPAYTRLEPYDLRVGQTVAEALRGSRLQFHIRTNKPVVKTELVREMAGSRKQLGSASRPASPGPEAGSRQAYTAEDAPMATPTKFYSLRLLYPLCPLSP